MKILTTEAQRKNQNEKLQFKNQNFEFYSEFLKFLFSQCLRASVVRHEFLDEKEVVNVKDCT